MSCASCPCPGPAACPPVYCEWAAERPQDEVRLRHVRARMGCGDTPALALAVPPPGARPSGIRKELVVCRYKEDVAWLDLVPAEFHVSLYDKSDEPYRVARAVRRERLPNVGRESHSMLHHVARYYGGLAEWTYFAQGDALDHAPDFLGRLAVDYADVCTLTEGYSATHPPAAVRAFDRVEVVGGFRVRYGDALAQVLHGRPWFNPRAWERAFAGPMPSPLRFGYAAMYAVPRARILARPRTFWLWLLGEAERSPWHRDEHTERPLTPWQFEALWWYLFADPADYPHRPPGTAAVATLRRLAACPYRSRDAGCGCSGARCALKGGAPVSGQQCIECLETYH